MNQSDAKFSEVNLSQSATLLAIKTTSYLLRIVFDPDGI